MIAIVFLDLRRLTEQLHLIIIRLLRSAYCQVRN